MIEILLVTVIIWFIFPAMISVYTFMIRSNKQLLARETAIQQWYEFFEKLNILMQDYTIDYEEYYNRQMVWCVEWWWVNSDFTWNIWVDWYCTKPTGYWNENSTQRQWWSQTISSTSHNIYYCSTAWVSEALHPANWCPVVVKNTTCWNKWTKQSFGQYKAFFIDAGSNKCLKTDDEDLWNLVNANIKAIRDADNIQELYLISHDWKSRLYFRRKKVAESGRYAQYKIQMLRLRWFDAWEKHNFNETNNEWLYDWQIDTWACDTSMWFVWGGNSIWWAYADYNLPDSENIDDCWVDLTYWSTSVYTWKISISPLWDPDLFWSVQDRQINPYMKIFLVNGVYFPNFSNDMSIGSSIESFKVPLQTTINMKNFYE
jgi:hypothetical protein